MGINLAQNQGYSRGYPQQQMGGYQNEGVFERVEDALLNRQPQGYPQQGFQGGPPQGFQQGGYQQGSYEGEHHHHHGDEEHHHHHHEY
jgi:hypothetical protein